MTDKEKAIVMANTGITMLTGDKFNIFHEYIEKILGRPVWTHELGDESVWNEIKKKSKDDFIEICKTEDAPTIKEYTGWIKVKDQLPKVPEGKQLVDVLVVAKVYFVPDHVDQRNWTYVVEKAIYEPKYGFYGNNIRDYNVKEWMYAPQLPKRYARYIWKEEE